MPRVWHCQGSRKKLSYFHRWGHPNPWDEFCSSLGEYKARPRSSVAWQLYARLLCSSVSAVSFGCSCLALGSSLPLQLTVGITLSCFLDQQPCLWTLPHITSSLSKKIRNIAGLLWYQLSSCWNLPGFPHAVLMRQVYCKGPQTVPDRLDYFRWSGEPLDPSSFWSSLCFRVMKRLLAIIIVTVLVVPILI